MPYFLDCAPVQNHSTTLPIRRTLAENVGFHNALARGEARINRYINLFRKTYRELSLDDIEFLDSNEAAIRRYEAIIYRCSVNKQETRNTQLYQILRHHPIKVGKLKQTGYITKTIPSEETIEIQFRLAKDARETMLALTQDLAFLINNSEKDPLSEIDEHAYSRLPRPIQQAFFSEAVELSGMPLRSHHPNVTLKKKGLKKEGIETKTSHLLEVVMLGSNRVERYLSLINTRYLDLSHHDKHFLKNLSSDCHYATPEYLPHLEHIITLNPLDKQETWLRTWPANLQRTFYPERDSYYSELARTLAKKHLIFVSSVTPKMIQDAQALEPKVLSGTTFIMETQIDKSIRDCEEATKQLIRFDQLYLFSVMLLAFIGKQIKQDYSSPFVIASLAITIISSLRNTYANTQQSKLQAVFDLYRTLTITGAKSTHHPKVLKTFRYLANYLTEQEILPWRDAKLNNCGLSFQNEARKRLQLGFFAMNIHKLYGLSKKQNKNNTSPNPHRR